jgi:hypothetical protein
LCHEFINVVQQTKLTNFFHVAHPRGFADTLATGTAVKEQKINSRNLTPCPAGI